MEISNCDELLIHLLEAYDDNRYAGGGQIMFQGEICEVGGFMPGRWCTLMPSKKFYKTVFAVDSDIRNKNIPFFLYVFKGDEFTIDQTLAIMLPSYIKEELIATIKGEW